MSLTNRLLWAYKCSNGHVEEDWRSQDEKDFPMVCPECGAVCKRLIGGNIAIPMLWRYEMEGGLPNPTLEEQRKWAKQVEERENLKTKSIDEFYEP